MHDETREQAAAERIAAELRCMLYGTPYPSDDDYAQCRTMNLSYGRFAKMCGHADYKNVTEDECNSVYEAGLKICLVLGFGYHTILIGGDFHRKPQYLQWS